MNDEIDSLPAAAASHLREARRLHGLREFAAASREYQLANAAAPGTPLILAGFAALAMDAGDWQAALPVLRALEAHRPGGQHRARLALTLFNLGHYAEALPLLEQLIAAGETEHACVVACAACRERTGREAEAIDLLERLYRALPTADEAVRLVSMWVRLSRADLLARRLPELLADHPGDTRLLSAQSEDAFCRGDYARGYDLMHHRWAASLEPPKSARLDCAEWDGKAFAGTLLLSCEQGLGDEILASQVFGELVALGQRCLIDADARLLPVFRRSFPQLDFCDRRSETLIEASRGGDCRKLEALELGRFFRRDPAAFPVLRQWLYADPARSAALREQLRKAHPGKRLIGLSWRSVRAFIGDAKSIPLSELAPLLALPDCVFVDLQYGDTAAERAAQGARTGVHIEHLPELDLSADIDGLFALVDALDAVVSCSNTTVHVAGALGKRVHAMIPGSRYVLWYWGYEGESTPWYPSVSLLRGPSRRPWRELAGEIAGRIEKENPR